MISAIPIVEENTHVSDIEYSPLVGGFGITLNDGRAAFLTATTLKFDPNVSRMKFVFLSSWMLPNLIFVLPFVLILFYIIFLLLMFKFWIEPNISKVRVKFQITDFSNTNHSIIIFCIYSAYISIYNTTLYSQNMLAVFIYV